MMISLFIDYLVIRSNTAWCPGGSGAVWLSQNREMHLSKESIVFQVMHVFVLVLLSDARCASRLTAAYSYTSTNAMTGDVGFIIG